ncbi:hypothetical protein BgAZ_101320 [Babesia gibsoni]|uniref:SWIRM domain-containing protein n=1 Tax=Babesia gibsoni TaxID=33632 RepID=A0AAD8PF55_BABGI|nr:hypothetical protein BgAZ_101320 [Babesia gibsoni]
MRTNDRTLYRGNLFAEAMGIKVDGKEESKDESIDVPFLVRNWLLPDSVNDIEKEYLKSIFKGYKCNERDSTKYYLRIRNNIIELYNKDISKYITSKDCITQIALRTFSERDFRLKHFKRDVNAIKHKDRVSGECNLDDVLPTVAEGHDEEDALMLRRAKDEEDQLADFSEPFIGLRGSMDFNEEGAPRRGKKCQTCQIECKYIYFMITDTVIREDLKKYNDCVWCSRCYSNSLYPLDVPRNSLSKVLVPLGTRWSDHPFISCKWDDEKREKLYDAVYRLGLNWDLVRQEVGDDVTVRECIYQFLLAPLEEETSNTVRMRVNFSDIVNAKDEIPFHANPNAINTFLSFCSTTLSPIVASRSAKVILDHVMRGDPSVDSVAKDIERSCIVGNRGNHDMRHQLKNGKSRARESYNKEEFRNTDMLVPHAEEALQNHSFPIAQVNGSRRLNEMSNPTIAEYTLYEALKEGFQASIETCAELAEMEQERINDTLNRLISLKMKRIKEKMRLHAQTEEQIDNNNIRMVLKLSQKIKRESEGE